MRTTRYLRRTTRAVIGVLALSTLPCALVTAQQKNPKLISLEQYLDWEEVSAPQLSPDGSQIAFGRRWVDKMNDKWESSVWIMNADGTRPRLLVQGSDVKWSPDGSRIAYIARGEPSGQQIFVRWMDGNGSATQISHLTDSPTGIEWSPDGKSIAFTAPVPVKDPAWRIPMPAAPKGAKWTEPPKIVTRLNYRSDRVGYTDDNNRQIFVIPSDGGTARQMTDGEFNAAGPNYSADGKWIYFSSYREPNAGDASAFRRSQVYAANNDGRDQAAHARQRHEQWPASVTGRQDDRVHACRLGRTHGLRRSTTVHDEHRRVESARRLARSRSADLGTRLGAGQQRRVLQRRE